MRLCPVTVLLIVLSLPGLSYAQRPTIDEPRDEDTHLSTSRGEVYETRNDTLRGYMAIEIDTAVRRSYRPGVDAVPAEDRYKIIQAADSAYYYIDRLHRTFALGAGGGGTPDIPGTEVISVSAANQQDAADKGVSRDEKFIVADPNTMGEQPGQIIICTTCPPGT
jgi:hypothetical protein